jgi:hypothetical protein
MQHLGCLMMFSAGLACCWVTAEGTETPLQTGIFKWESSPPLVDVGPGKQAPDPLLAIKDPTIVQYQGRWHMFATIRAQSGKVDIAYLNFTNWSDAQKSPGHVLALHDQYYCAPQIFYFRPQQKWYLIYQLAEKARTPAFGPCFSTSTNIVNPKSWSRPVPMVTNAPPDPKWLDFWVICDEQKAHLFYTSLDGRMWRRESRKSDFPFGWSEQVLALQADIFEASHTYRLKGLNRYLTLVEAQRNGRRYYKAYLADKLEGPWQGLADTLQKPFAARGNVEESTEWTTNISHGELLRAGVDEQLEVDPENLQFLFQGANDEEYRGRQYGTIPWRLGLLKLK